MIEILSVAIHLSNKTCLGRDFFFSVLKVLLKIFYCNLVFRGPGTKFEESVIFYYIADDICAFIYSFRECD